MVTPQSLPNQAEAVGAVASPLRLLLSCPKCDVSGWIKWSSLQRGIRCPKCRCEFLIASTGQMQKIEELPRRRFTCPRCGKSGAIAATLVVQKAECGECRLPLVAGPDRRLHDVREAAELQRAAKRKRPISYREWLHANLRRDDGRLRKAYISSVVSIAVAIAIGGLLGIRMLLDRSPETMAKRFTKACLSGDFRAAEHYLPDDDVQRVEFERWRTRHFSSIIKKFRPAGDYVGLQAVVVTDSQSSVTVEIVMKSNFLGTRSVKQVWRSDDHERWQFDVCQTLAAEDGPRRPAAMVTARLQASRIAPGWPESK